jgi:hypothetical protein
MSNSTDETVPPIPLEDILACLREQRPPRLANQYQIVVANEHLEKQVVCIDDPVPTGLQILEAAGYIPANNFMLLMLQGTGMLEEVNLSETVDVYQQGVEQFVVFASDRIFYFELNGRRFPWGGERISESTLRTLGDVPVEQSLWLEQLNKEDVLLGNTDKIDLSESGLERLYSKKSSWILNVHGVRITSEQPTILASEAMQLAGFNPAEGWILILKVKGEPKQSITVDDVIDLTKPGIEKLRLTPAEINNGEAAGGLRTDFALLEKDAAYLETLGAQWETLVDAKRRWLVIRGYKLPSGYNHSSVDVAIDIPATYPDAAIDMFYCNPPLALTSGGVIAQTSSTVLIGGVSYQQWSRHLNGATRWNPLTDSVITQMAVVEESLLREVGE